MPRVVATLLAVVDGSFFGASALITRAGASPRAADRSCEEILSAHAFFTVTVHRGGVSCATAQRVVREFMGGGGVEHGGPSAYQMWWSLGQWRCGYGAGGGACSRGGSNYGNATDAIIAEWVAWECGYKPPGATVPCADTAADAFNSVRRANLHPVPLWPTYLPSRIKNGTWMASNLKGNQPYPAYPDNTASGRSAYRLDYGYQVSSSSQVQMFGAADSPEPASEA